MNTITTAAAFTLFLICSAFTSLNAATFTVTRTDDRNSVCNSGVDCSLREAVAAARTTPQAGANIVNFMSGITLVTLTNEIEISVPSAAIEIRGPGADILTINGGSGANRIFSTLNAGVTISGVTLTGGNGTGNNRLGFGGAIHIDSGTVLLDAVNITGNSTSSAGGGVLVNNGTLRIINSTISGNTANNCGGVSNSSSQLFIANSTISGNQVSQQGGGLCANSNTTLRNVTITNNFASNGGGILKAATGTLDLGNTIVAGNGATEIRFNQPGTIISAGNNLIGDAPGDSANTSSPVTYHPSDILDTPPKLDTLSANGGPTPTHALGIDSPAIDHGNDSITVDPSTNSALNADQRAFNRFYDGDANGTVRVDIGAFELRTFS